jgi:hypothetical protein
MSAPTKTPPSAETSPIGCSIKTLPRELWAEAAQKAIEINPANRPQMAVMAAVAPDVLQPLHLSLMTAKRWSPNGVHLTVGFMDNPPADLRQRILSHLNAWGLFGNIRFVETATSPQVRIARTAGDGYWSYLGTDVLLIPANQPTMNLDSFTMNTPDSEFFRVVRHEAGHTLGFPHEHMRQEIVDRIDREKAIALFMATQGWTRDEVIAQVLTPMSNSALIATAQPDDRSIMCYSLPASIMKDGVAVPGGRDINATDGQFAGQVYPRVVERGHLLHLSGVTGDGRLWHTIRGQNGAWFQFGDVEGQAGDRGSIVDVDLQSVGLEVHLCAINTAGNLWHTIRRADGTWFPFGDVEGQTGDRGLFRRVGAAEVNGELHVCGRTADGRLWHTIRRANGTWFPFGDVEGQTGDRGAFTDVDCAGVNGELHVSGVTSDGRLWHAIRRANGSWTPFGDVEGQTGDRGQIREVACAGVNGELHLCAISSVGRLWHTIRRANGTWFPFGDVEGQAGDRGTFVRVSIGECGGELHVAGTTGVGRLWHTIRRANGTWFPFGDVEGQAGDRGSFLTVSVDGLFRP